MIKRFLAAVLVAMSLAGCGTIGPLLSPEASFTVAKVEYGFEATYNVAGNAYLTAARAGQLSAETKAKAKALLGQAYQALLIARKAQALGDAGNVETQSAIIAALSVQVIQLVKGAVR